MTTSTPRPLDPVEELDPQAASRVAGGMINLYEDGPRPHPPIEPGHGGLDTPYWATGGAMRYGAGPWDYGYGSPTGPWPV
jgi:hypothetical protein